MEKFKAFNNIPKHWQVKKLGEVCNVLDNLRKPINSTERLQRITGKIEKDLFPYYGATGQVGWIDDFITHDEYVLVGEDGAPFLDLFKAKAYKIKGKTWVNNHAHILKGKENVLINDFLHYYLNSINYREFVNGTTRLKLTKSSLLEIPFVIPPLSEQQAIVSKIEELLSDLDNGKQQLQTAQQQLKVYRQSLLKWAFDNITTPLIKTVEESCTHIVDCLHSTAKFSLQGKYCVDTTCIENGRIVFENIRFVDDKTYNERISRLKPEYGDILFSREGTVGTTLIVPKNIELCLGQRMMMFRFKKEILPKYILYYFQSSKFKSQYQPLIMGTTAPHLNIRDIRKFNITLCSLSEQQQIVDELESKLTVCDKIEETISQSLLQAETLRQSILKKAFEGRLV